MKSKVAVFAGTLVLSLAGCQNAEAPAQASAQAEVSASAAAQAPATAPEVVVAKDCGINAPAPGGTFDRTSKLSVWGYAINSDTSTIPPNVAVRIQALDGAHGITLEARRGERPDVAEALQNPALTGSGFGVEADVSTLPEGEYVVSVLQPDGDKVRVCNNPLPITLK